MTGDKTKPKEAKVTLYRQPNNRPEDLYSNLNDFDPYDEFSKADNNSILALQEEGKNPGTEDTEFYALYVSKDGRLKAGNMTVTKESVNWRNWDDLNPEQDEPTYESIVVQPDPNDADKVKLVGYTKEVEDETTYHEAKPGEEVKSSSTFFPFSSLFGSIYRWSL